MTFLCKVYGIDLQAKNQNNNTCVHAAVLGIGGDGSSASRRIECLELLQNTLADWSEMIQTKNATGEKPVDCIKFDVSFSQEREKLQTMLKSAP